jgi:hypothetical protein
MAGAAMAIVAFIALFGHGLLIAGYYFSDAGFLANQRTTAALADSDRMVKEMAMAQIVVNAVNQLKAELTASVTKGDGAAMGAALQKITGEEWSLQSQPIPPAAPMRQFAADANKMELAPKDQAGNNQPPRQNP